MVETVSLEQLLRRLVGGFATDADRQALKDAVAADRLSLATGTRAVALGATVTDMVIVTGDHNFVFKDGDAATLRQAFLALYPSRLHQLPADLPDFTGRGQDVERLLHLFLESSGQAVLSALGGMGGMGKTALAVHVAHKLAIHYPEAQLVVDLKGTSEVPLSPAAAMGRVITAFEPQARLPEQVSEVAALYHSLLAGRRILLLLDNAKDAAQVRDLLPNPPSAALITSRRIIVLPGLTPLNLDVLSKSEAVDLLCTIFGEGRATEEELAALAALCGRLPLALRAAGSFLATHPDWDVGEYLEVLAQEKERLRRLKHEDLDVEAALGLSAAMLTRENPEWAGRWQTLTVFPASFKRGGAAAVWQVETEEARATLGELLIRSLVLYDSETGCYRLHDLIRLVARNAFGYGGAVPDTPADQARLARAATNHAVYYEKTLREANALYEQGGEAMGLGLEIFDREWDNIRAGQAWAANNAKTDPGATQLCSNYADAGAYLFPLRMHPRDWIIWLESALASARRLENRSNEVGHLGNLAIAYTALGEYRRAIEFNKQVLSISREMGRHRVEGKALINLAIAYSNLGECHRAINYLEQSLLYFQQMSDRQGEGIALSNLGTTYARLGKYPQAIKIYEQRLAISRELGDRGGEGSVLGNLGSICNSLGQYPGGIEFLEQALDIFRDLGDRKNEGSTLSNLGVAYAAMRKYYRGIEFFEHSIAIARELDDRRGEGTALANLGKVYGNLEEYGRAIEFYEQAQVIFQEIGDRQEEGNAWWNMSLALDRLGERQQALAKAHKALEIFEQIESPAADLVRQNLAMWRRET